MVGGTVFRIQEINLAQRKLFVRDQGGDLCAVHCGIGKDGAPEVGDQVWWQGGRIWLDDDTKSVDKFGHSYSLPRSFAVAS